MRNAPWSIALILSAGVPAAAQQATFEELLPVIAAYEVGDSEQPLAEMRQLVATGSGSPATMKSMEQAFLKVLEGESSLTGKNEICRHLMLVGSAASVPALARMLGAAETADMARYALERIPGPAVNQALREMLARTSGKARVGIVNTLGRRGDTGAVVALAGLIQSSDPMVAAAAASSLGWIADSSAASALAEVRPKTSGALRAEVNEAYLRCAEQMVERGDRKRAFGVFLELSAMSEPEPVRIAALRGLAISGGNDAVPLLITAMRSSRQPGIQAQAIRQLSAIPGAGVTRAMGQALRGLSEPARIQGLAALADRGDKVALPVVVAATKDEAQPVRAAALLALGKIGDTTVITLLGEAAARASTVRGATGEQSETRTGGFPNERGIGPAEALTEAAAARASLYRLVGADVDEAILAAMPGAAQSVKVELIAATAERGIRTATPALLVSAGDANREVRRAALRALRNTAAPSDLPVLLDMLGEAPPAERPEVARVVSSALRGSDSSSVAPVVSAYQGSTDADLRGALLSVLAQVGRDESLPLLRAALKESNPELQRGAVRALSDWPNTMPMNDLADIARTGSNPVLQVLALQGYIRMIGLPNGRPPAATVKLLSDAMSLARRAEEKKAVLSMVQGINTADALGLAEAAAKDPEVAGEASMAADRIRQRLLPRRPQ